MAKALKSQKYCHLINLSLSLSSVCKVFRGFFTSESVLYIDIRYVVNKKILPVANKLFRLRLIPRPYG